MSEARARAALGGHKGGAHKAHKGHVHSVHVRRAAGGGFIAKNEREQDPNDPGMGGPPEEHVLPDQESLVQHMQDHLGDQPAAGQMQEAPAAAAAPPPQGQ